MDDDVVRLYSVRKAVLEGSEFSVQRHFWPAFKSHIDKFNTQGYFSEKLNVIPQDSLLSPVNAQRVNKELAIFNPDISLSTNRTPSQYHIFDLVEFFYLSISTPSLQIPRMKEYPSNYTTTINEGPD